ncbi:fructosamine kinase family protein [Mycobacterium sp. 141]|uniref:fructosamine kinase family protein n=1 Tax=Mycobacterium sp. 141 TaxID=1120797 RepID=UPI0003825E98|nr:fructosamine kinase family protein [Mycobacterium sp. 141]
MQKSIAQKAGLMDYFVKRNPAAPQGFFAAEAAGLQWLTVDGGVPCARVLAYDATSLTLQRLQSVAPSARAAHEFGRMLAVTHNAGAAAFGAGPDGYRGAAFFGPMTQPLPMSLSHHGCWGEFYAQERLEPMGALAAGRLDAAARRGLAEVAALCRAGRFDDDEGPARLHGDLWSGNVMWTADGVVLIDPAAHGGHRETDLAMLTLFGCPHLGEVLAGYQSVCPLRDGWQGRVGLHQLYPLLAHVVLFGGGYAGQVAAVVAKLLRAGS